MSLEGSWVVESLAVGGELVSPLGGKSALTIEVADGRVSGSAGVNRFMGRLGEGDRPFEGPLATTMMAGPEDMMIQERVFLDLLSEVDTVEKTSEGILLLADGLVVVALNPGGTD